MQTALYRHFDERGRLLYVGISLAPVDRLASHAGGSHWAQQIARVTIEWLPSREEALAAERAAIVAECPLHNVIHSRGLPAAPPPPRAARYVSTPEQVAVHLAVGSRTVLRMSREGMPREQISARRYRYELGAIEDWLRARAAVADARKRTAERAAEEETLRVMDKAFRP